MPDIATISAFLGSIKTAKDTLTLLLDASKTLEKAELEYKIASLTKTLTEIENQAREFEKVIQEKDKTIEELKKRLKIQPNLVRQDGCYFDINELEKNHYEPFCSKCWEVNNLPVHLKKVNSMLRPRLENPTRLLSYVCPVCNNSYQIQQKLR